MSTDKELKSEAEINFAATFERNIMLGECKWRSEINDVSELNKLIEEVKFFRAYKEKYFYFF